MVFRIWNQSHGVRAAQSGQKYQYCRFTATYYNAIDKIKGSIPYMDNKVQKFSNECDVKKKNTLKNI